MREIVLDTETTGFDPAEGHRLGFINEVVARGALQSTVDQYCADILRGSPAAIQASKQTLMRGLDEGSIAQAMQRQASYPEFARWRTSKDAQEGPRAFAEKRAPRWES